jgi:hypothetical protein
MFKELILVPGHAVWNLREDPMLDSSWYLKPYQNSEPRYFVEHILAGVQLAAARPEALLMFSGAATEREAGPLTEALGYWRIAEWYGWWGKREVRERAVLEEYALDSFLNVLYGLHRYRQVAGEWPERVTVCGWGFKGRRIGVLHREALGWTRPFEYVGVNEPPNLEVVERREAVTCAEFEADPWGERPPIADKREARAAPGYAVPYATGQGGPRSCERGWTDR